jgi:hypothetical protein
MKIKQIYISDENHDKLKEVNASALVNELLTNHFKNMKKETKSEIETKLRIAKIELEATKKIEGLKNEIYN